MATGKPSKKPASGATGVKMLITAASLAATVGGWAMISAKEAEPPLPPPAPDQTAMPVLSIKLAPLPTLVPPITSQPRPNTIKQSRPAASAPPPAASNEIVLRDVSAPALPNRSAPAPVANTRSSR